MTPNPPPPPPPPASPGAPASEKTPTLPIVAIILAGVGMCIPCLGPIGLILGIVALVKAPPSGKGKPLSIAAIVVGALGMVFSIGMMAAIAIPNFIKFQAQSKQAECKAELARVYQAQVEYQNANGSFATTFEQLGLTFPETRYVYIAGPEAVSTPAPAKAPNPPTPEDLPTLTGEVMPGVEGTCPDCTFTAACIANIDTDEAFDVWSVSSSDRSDEEGEVIPAGDLHHDVDDVTE